MNASSGLRSSAHLRGPVVLGDEELYASGVELPSQHAAVQAPGLDRHVPGLNP